MAMGAEADDVARVGARVEGLLADLERLGDPLAHGKAEELVALLVELYGEALGRIVNVIADAVDVDDPLVHKLLDDRLIEAILILHDLHPLSTEERVSAALDSVRPYLGSHAGGVEVVGVHEGVVDLRLQGSCEGCPSSTMTVKLAIEKAILDGCPDISAIHVEGMVAEAARPAGDLLQIEGLGMGSNGSGVASGNGSGHGHGSGQAGGGWTVLEELGPLLPGTKRSLRVEGIDMLICSVAGSLYAYLDSCAACGSVLRSGSLEDNLLTCPSCGSRFDVRLAGRSQDDPQLHLHPFPMLPEAGGWKVALSSATY
jgi:Fe-S cluster biogenesis protein NfuA/nitrite reductase/ring-hydroxylating ferredoxin subunit